ncbi:MAG: aminoacyl-tRNA hydrolase [Spirochaetota bacterium]
MEFAAICLGNPGSQYSETRHNAGFFVARRVAELLDLRFRRALLRPLRYARAHPLVMVLPLTYMNRSGTIIPYLDRAFPESRERLVVVFDQMDLPPGVVRLKRGGGSGGHRGVQSVLDHAREREILKLAVGIGRPAPGQSVTDYVLSSPESDESRLLESGCDLAADAVLRLRDEDIASVMNRVNNRVKNA